MQQAFFVRFVGRVAADPKDASHDFYQKHGEKLDQFMQELNAGKEMVERLYARWNELEGLK